MASKQMLIIFAVVMAISVLPMITLAKTFTVGDGQGWTTGFDYQAWAKDKKIRVGDTLVFKYSKGAHNVQKVDGNGFDKCIKPSLNEALTTGNDAIRLTSIGKKKWYICGVGNHCRGEVRN
ncbi:hypothetical protein IFM89_006760 [Coptis chinensis]|uniref:Phytocyanin domain-containing protein n=1 Tax=Coptis chinensis TaxID=261450 RepID=A0A835I8L0_9MAGN|nr:hypothetical protein IFM89_006760 [Coptis chinensis]